MPDLSQDTFSTKVWQPGSSDFPTLLEHYQIHGIVGEGGMGTVFKAYHLNLKRLVAIKTLRIDQHKGAELVGRFKQEMELVGQMDHPNVVRATDAGEKNGVFYLVMEYLSGADLSRLSAKRGRLEVAFACELVRQAALGLDYIHDKTLIHRDIKPSNLMLTTAGQVKVLDLGLARFGLNHADHYEKTPAGYAVGTYSYIAPEQATAGAVIDGRADIYSLGCTLFKLATGRTPFSGADYDNPAKVLFAHCHIGLSSLPEFSSIPENLKGVLAKMTARDPRQRYRTGREVADALAPLIGEGARSQQTPLLAWAQVEVEETPVKPLSDPLPHELSRLTASMQETPRETPPARVATQSPATKQTPAWPRWAIGGGGLLVSLALAWMLSPLLLAPFREIPEPKKDSEKPAAAIVDVKKPAGDPNKMPDPPEIVTLPVEAEAVRNIDTLKAGQFHDLFKDPKFPPILIGFHKEDGLASARWYPGQEKVEINPTSVVLAQLGTTSKEKPAFTLQTKMNQQRWHGNVGIFFGYEENRLVKNQKKSGVSFARFQMLYVRQHQNEATGLRYSVVRGKADLHYNQQGQVALMAQHDITQDFLDNLGGEQVFMVVVKNGKLTHVTFNGGNLKKRLCAHYQVNDRFQPSDYQGAFGIYAAFANVTVRNASVMRHDD
jgi:eukaryotic-like serine/threonine-protein kinase